MAPSTAVIVTGAALDVPAAVLARAHPAAPGAGTARSSGVGPVVIAADGGLAAAMGAGLGVDHVVGDLDSADPGLVEAARAGGATVHRFPPDKDATDLELALELAADLGVTAVTVLSGHGARFDHLVAETALLSSPRWAGLVIDAWYPPAHLSVARPGAEVRIDARPGALVSLVPVHGPATVTTTGLSWPLHHEVLPAGTSRGVSNLTGPDATGGTAGITVHAGQVLVIRPFASEEEPS